MMENGVQNNPASNITEPKIRINKQIMQLSNYTGLSISMEEQREREIRVPRNNLAILAIDQFMSKFENFVANKNSQIRVEKKERNISFFSRAKPKRTCISRKN